MRFVYRNDGRLFRNQRVSTAPHSLDADSRAASRPTRQHRRAALGAMELAADALGPERAVLELLDELPDHESFHQADMLMEGLQHAQPAPAAEAARRLPQREGQAPVLLLRRPPPARLAQAPRQAAIDLGTGKRMLVKGGKLDAKHLITVPEDLDGVR